MGDKPKDDKSLEELKEEVHRKEKEAKPLLDRYLKNHYPDLDRDEAFRIFMRDEFLPYCIEEDLKELAEEMEKDRKKRERARKKGYIKITDVIE